MVSRGGAWDHARRRPESALEFCENMLACLERAGEAERDEYWQISMARYLAKRDQLRVGSASRCRSAFRQTCSARRLGGYVM
jgi:hypothetical protein